MDDDLWRTAREEPEERLDIRVRAMLLVAAAEKLAEEDVSDEDELPAHICILSQKLRSR